MSGNILYEPTSTRNDYGVLVITTDYPCIIPFYFEILYEHPSTDAKHCAEIESTDEVVFVFKSNENLITPVLRKTYTNVENNVVLLTLDSADLRKLYGNKQYYLGVYQYSDNAVKRVLIRKLPVKIEGVIQDVL